jgi:O-6-methylguanine DNA methyltransferase
MSARRQPAASPFTRRVLTVVARIPAGRCATYGDIAALAGAPGAARAVGSIMRSAPRRGLPYHRVVGAGGAIGGYGGRWELKAALLRAEGVIISGRRIARFADVRWRATRRGRTSTSR